MSPTSVLHAISSYGPTAASTRVRLYDWFRHLGIEATHHDYAGLKNNRPQSIAAHPAAVTRAEFALRRLDVTGQRVVLSREASPFGHGELEERLLRRASHGTYDFDDALFQDRSAARRIFRTGAKSRRAAAAADVVIAGNDYLADWASHYNSDVRIIPSCVDPRDYIPKTTWVIAGDAPSLVWLGSPATEQYVAQIVPGLLEVHRLTGATLTLISGPSHNPELEPLRHMLRRIRWSPGTFARTLAEADIAIAPLDDSPYSRGKCAYKLVQYAASGLPMVGSPVGANALALRRFNGAEALSIDDWIQSLLAMTSDSASSRAARGAAGRESVEADYSFNAWRLRWLDATGLAETSE